MVTGEPEPTTGGAQDGAGPDARPRSLRPRPGTGPLIALVLLFGAGGTLELTGAIGHPFSTPSAGIIGFPSTARRAALPSRAAPAHRVRRARSTPTAVPPEPAATRSSHVSAASIAKAPAERIGIVPAPAVTLLAPTAATPAPAPAVPVTGAPQPVSATPVPPSPPPSPPPPPPSAPVAVPLTLSLASAPQPVVGEPFTLDVAVTGATAGSVTIAAPGDQASPPVPVVNGLAAVPVTLQHGGSNTVTATFAGDDGLVTVTRQFTLVVLPAPTALHPRATEVNLDHTRLIGLSFSAELVTQSDGAPLAGKVIAFGALGAVACTATTGADGVAACQAPLELPVVPAVILTTISFAGDDDYTSSTASRYLLGLAGS